MKNSFKCFGFPYTFIYIQLKRKCDRVRFRKFLMINFFGFTSLLFTISSLRCLYVTRFYLQVMSWHKLCKLHKREITILRCHQRLFADEDYCEMDWAQNGAHEFNVDPTKYSQFVFKAFWDVFFLIQLRSSFETIILQYVPPIWKYKDIDMLFFV